MSNQPTTTESPAETTGNKEAAKYRTQLREAEAARDGAVAQVSMLQKQIIHTHLGDLKPEAFDLVHPDITDLVNEDGTVNVDTVKEAVNSVREQLGIPTPPSAPILSNIGGQPQQAHSNGFTEAFAPQSD